MEISLLSVVCSLGRGVPTSSSSSDPHHPEGVLAPSRRARVGKRTSQTTHPSSSSHPHQPAISPPLQNVLQQGPHQRRAHRGSSHPNCRPRRRNPRLRPGRCPEQLQHQAPRCALWHRRHLRQRSGTSLTCPIGRFHPSRDTRPALPARNGARSTRLTIFVTYSTRPLRRPTPSTPPPSPLSRSPPSSRRMPSSPPSSPLPLSPSRTSSRSLPSSRSTSDRTRRAS